jgi:hypothetical protein
LDTTFEPFNIAFSALAISRSTALCCFAASHCCFAISLCNFISSCLFLCSSFFFVISILFNANSSSPFFFLCVESSFFLWLPLFWLPLATVVPSEISSTHLWCCMNGMQFLAHGHTSFLVVEAQEWLGGLRMTIEDPGHQLRAEIIVEIRLPHHLTKPNQGKSYKDDSV